MSDNSALPRRLLLAFSLPAVMQGLMHAPEFQVQGIYAKYTGLSLTALAGAILLTRVFDAITYPLIGHWSDLSFRRSGSRKSWIVAGTMVTVCGIWFLFRPPQQPSITYYTLWAMVSYVGWKLTEIPYAAWSLGLTRDYVQRTRVQLWLTMAALSGTLLFFSVPFAAKALGLTDSTELNLQTLSLTAVLVLACVPLINLYSLASVPNGEAASPVPRAGSTGSWRELVRAMAGNRPLLRLLAATVPVILLNGFSTGTTFLYVDVYLHLGKQLPLIQLVGLPLTLLGLPFWGWLCQKFERHRVWAVSLVAAAVCNGVMAFAPIGQAGLYLILALYPITLFCVVCMFIAVPAMIGDIVDDDRLRTGEDRAGVYSAIYAFLCKSLITVAGACGIALVGWFGFDATAGQQSAWGAFGIKLVTVGLPALGFAASAPLIWRFPIDRARQREIREAMRALETPGSGNPPLNPGDAQRDAAQA